MEFILIAVIVVVVIAVIAYPLVNAPEDQQADTPNALDNLIAQRDSAYDAIRDLDFDYQLGKLSRSDYESLRDKYRARAAEVLRQIDLVAGTGKADQDIEAEVARLRRRRPVGTDTSSGSAPVTDAEGLPTRADEIETQVARLRARRAGKTGMETPAPADAGGQSTPPVEDIEAQVARLRKRAKATSLQCSNCKAPISPEDIFCPKCGVRLQAKA